MMHMTQHYNHEKYWKMHNEVINSNSKKNILVRYFYLFRVKRSDAFNNASFGTDIDKGAYFKTPPILPHHLNGIIVSPYAKIGKNVTIFQQVTIGQAKDNKAAVIGDNVMIGAGVKIIGNIKIGNNVKIGAGCIVCEDVPDNATVVMNKPRIIIRKC
ncbi:transferase family hexapeptide repeat protein [Longibaculum muris]|uniref:Serine acetyltransferase n=2 Tax=Longibaculum muris TaxID=1796628 RepID=A0A4R3Z4M7_9FIRM|nr:bacterial transferase hexapeptide repeat protein [Candidatus Stoquefichus sp. KLE1796]TCW01006.1 transferase family hexapeptide repeat protein [Longibaculum muris]